MSDIWDDLLNSEIEPPPEMEEIPKDKWVIARVVGGESGAAPKVRKAGREGQEFYKFETGLVCQGGEAAITARHVGRYLFFDSYVNPHPDGPRLPVAGKLMGFLTATLATGVAEGEKDAKTRANARWQVVVKKLQAKASELGYEPSQFGGDVGLMLASTAAAVLKEETPYVLVKSRDGGSYEVGGETKKRPTAVAATEDYTVATVAKRKVVALSDDVPDLTAKAAW